MKRNEKLMQAAICLVLLLFTLFYAFPLEGTELSGGTVTGPVLEIFGIGSLLYLLAAILTVFYPRIAAGVIALATLLCLPLYFYSMAPGPFRMVFRGEYKDPLYANFYWGKWNLIALFLLFLSIFIACKGLFKQNLKEPSGLASHPIG